MGCRRFAFDSGHTLTELLVVFVILVILATVAVPSFQALIERHRVDTAANDLFAAITLTRAEAIRRNARVDLVPLDALDWASGWVIYVDENHNHTRDPDEKIIHAHAPPARGIAIKSVMQDSSTTYIAFGGNGRTVTNTNSQTPQAGHIALTLGRQQRRLILNFVGRPRLCNPVRDVACD